MLNKNLFKSLDKSYYSAPGIENNNTKSKMSVEIIENIVCVYINNNQEILGLKSIDITYNKLAPEIIHMKKRNKELVLARQISMYFSKKLIDISLSDIGKKIGNRDHATVLYAIRSINNICEVDKNFIKHIEIIERKIKSLY